jgi:hypothetical protein
MQSPSYLAYCGEPWLPPPSPYHSPKKKIKIKIKNPFEKQKKIPIVPT